MGVIENTLKKITEAVSAGTIEHISIRSGPLGTLVGCKRCDASFPVDVPMFASSVETADALEKLLFEHLHLEVEKPVLERAPVTASEVELQGGPEVAKQLENWFTYHPPGEGDAELYRFLREAGLMMARTICVCCPPSADRTAALRKVREAIMTANASIACGGK